MKEENTDNPLLASEVIDFVTMAIAYYKSVTDDLIDQERFVFVDKMCKLLPALYLKVNVLPKVEENDFVDLGQGVNEELYEDVRSKIITLLGEYDTYLDTFHEDMQYSDEPIARNISEDLSDVFQDLGDFLYNFREGTDEIRREALVQCKKSFSHYWGQRLLNALKALHSVRFNEQFVEEELKNDSIPS